MHSSRLISFRFQVLALLLTSLCVSCGYRFQGSGTILPQDVRKIAIAPVDNQTTESGLALILAESLRSRFERYGVLTIVEDQSDADAVLSSKITRIDTRVRNVTGETDVALELDLIMTISGELKRKNGQILWRNTKLEATQPFASTAGVVVTGSSSFAQGGIGASTLGSLDSLQVSRGQKDQALNDLVEEATRKLYLDAVAADF